MTFSWNAIWWRRTLNETRWKANQFSSLVDFHHCKFPFHPHFDVAEREKVLCSRKRRRKTVDIWIHRGPFSANGERPSVTTIRVKSRTHLFRLCRKNIWENRRVSKLMSSDDRNYGRKILPNWHDRNDKILFRLTLYRTSSKSRPPPTVRLAGLGLS